MEEQIEFFLEADSELSEFLLDNNLDIKQIVLGSNLEAKFGFSVDPGAHDGGLKEPVSIILASAGVILALTPILKSTIESISRKPVMITNKRLLPVEDSSGKVVLDKAGNPVTYWTEIDEFIEPKVASLEKQDVKLIGPMKLNLSFHSEKKA